MDGHEKGNGQKRETTKCGTTRKEKYAMDDDPGCVRKSRGTSTSSDLAVCVSPPPLPYPHHRSEKSAGKDRSIDTHSYADYRPCNFVARVFHRWGSRRLLFVDFVFSDFYPLIKKGDMPCRSMFLSFSLSYTCLSIRDVGSSRLEDTVVSRVVTLKSVPPWYVRRHVLRSRTCEPCGSHGYAFAIDRFVARSRVVTRVRLLLYDTVDGTFRSIGTNGNIPRKEKE